MLSDDADPLAGIGWIVSNWQVIAWYVGSILCWLGLGGLSILVQRSALERYDELPSDLQGMYRRSAGWAWGWHLLGGPIAAAYWGFVLNSLNRAEELADEG